MLYQSPSSHITLSPPQLSEVARSGNSRGYEHDEHNSYQHDDRDVSSSQVQHRIRNQLEDHSRMYGGSHWFAGGEIPETHVVGKASPAAGGRPNSSQHHQGVRGGAATSSLVDVSASSAHYHDFSSYLFEQRDEKRTLTVGTPTPDHPQRGRVDASVTPRPKALPSPLTAPRLQTTPLRNAQTSAIGPSPTMVTQHSPQRLGPNAQWQADTSDHHVVLHTHSTDLQDPVTTTQWDASGRMMYDVDVRPNTANMRTGVPRGHGGLDAIPAAARQAQRNIEDMQQDVARLRKLELQRKLREDLDEQIREKQKRKLKEWEAEVVTVYGPAMVLDDSHRKAVTKANHQSLQRVWNAQSEEASRRKAEEDAYYRPYEENWNDLKSDMDRMRHDDASQKFQRRQNSWLEAWKDQQAAEGELKKAAAAERYRQEQLTVAPHIANYSDRILLAEQQKREAHAAYNKALKEQVSDRNRRRYDELLQEHASDPGVHSYHRAPVQRDWGQPHNQQQQHMVRRV